MVEIKCLSRFSIFTVVPLKRLTFVLYRDFKLYSDASYGNCYTFNWNPYEKKNITRAGAIYGLNVLIHAEVDQYLFLSDSAGIRFAIHDQEQDPFPDTYGHSAPNGFVSSFGVKMVFLLNYDYFGKL